MFMFSELMKRVDSFHMYLFQGEKYYLRALGEDPRKDIANIHKQFPELAKDITFPDFIPEGKFFSSVFRIASQGIQLWTHYDASIKVTILL